MAAARIRHDAFCPSCQDTDCACECLCDLIADVRDDERRALGPYLRSGPEVAAENRP